MITIKDLQKYEAYVIEKRRQIHMYPEPGFQEVKTSALIEEELRKFGYTITKGIGKTGLTGTLTGKKDGKTVGLRADIDALVMQEENDVAYKSKIDGMMHSCGHDTHTAMLLGAAKYFSEHIEDLHGTVKVLFQSAEEGPMPGGGSFMVNEGHIDECDVVFGQHITTRDKTGTVVIKKGAAMAAPDEFKITVTGVGTHASAPHTGTDPIVIAAQVINALQTIVSRNVKPTEGAVVTVSSIHGGTAFNIIPEQVEMTGTIRTLNPETRAMVFKRMEDMCHHIGQMHNASIKLDITEAYPPVINDPQMSDFAMEVAKQVLGQENVIEADEPSMGGEDFAYYLQRKPGAFLWLGAGLEGDAAYNHNPKFSPDESAFIKGMAMHVNLVLEYLKK